MATRFLFALSLCFEAAAAITRIQSQELEKVVQAVEERDDHQPVPIYNNFAGGPWAGKEKRYVPHILVNYKGFAKIHVQHREARTEENHFDLVYLRDAHTNELVAGAYLTPEDMDAIEFKYDESIRAVHVYARHTLTGLWSEAIEHEEL